MKRALLLALCLVVPHLAQAAPRTTPAQRAVAGHLHQMAREQGTPMQHVLKTSIRANLVEVPEVDVHQQPGDHGAKVKFTAVAAERVPGGLRGEQRLVRISGTFITNSVNGPRLDDIEIEPQRAPPGAVTK